MVGEREHDDVERHQEEETVAETAESLLTFENAALPLSIISPAGVLIMANRAMRGLLGYQFSDLIGKSVFDVVVADQSELTRAWAAHLRGGADASAGPSGRAAPRPGRMGQVRRCPVQL